MVPWRIEGAACQYVFFAHFPWPWGSADGIDGVSEVKTGFNGVLHSDDPLRNVVDQVESGGDMIGTGG